MTKPPNPQNYSAVGVDDVAALLDLTDRQVRNLIVDKGLPAKKDSRGYTLNWRAVLNWWVDHKAGQKSGNGGNGKAGGGQNSPDEPEEDYKEALARKTRAEADLMELKLARERGQVAAISDVEKVLSAANSSTRTLIQAFPAQLAPQLTGLEDRGAIFTLLQRECNQLLGNIATMDAILEAGEIARDRDE